MASLLICSNAECRFMVDLHGGAQPLPRSELVLDECTECGHSCSSSRPFCGWPMETNLLDNLPHCSRCGRELRRMPSHEHSSKQ